MPPGHLPWRFSRHVLLVGDLGADPELARDYISSSLGMPWDSPQEGLENAACFGDSLNLIQPDSR